MKTYENFLNNFLKKKPEVNYYSNGHKRYEVWYLNGKYHREDGPAIQRWYENGQKLVEEWSLNGKNYRLDGPSVQKWFENGKRYSEEWGLNGEYHREDGPAYQQWFENGQKKHEIWYLNNKEYIREEWVEELKKIGSKHYQEQKILLNMEKYNI